MRRHQCKIDCSRWRSVVKLQDWLAEATRSSQDTMLTRRSACKDVSMSRAVCVNESSTAGEWTRRDTRAQKKESWVREESISSHLSEGREWKRDDSYCLKVDLRCNRITMIDRLVTYDMIPWLSDAYLLMHWVESPQDIYGWKSSRYMVESPQDIWLKDLKR